MHGQVLEALGEPRTDAGGLEVADDLALLIDTRLLERKMSCIVITWPSMPVTSLMCVTLREPSDMRADLDDDVDGGGDLLADGARRQVQAAIRIMFSIRARASRGVLAWTVLIEPSWPVFMACIMSKASEPRTSPTMMRSGRIRRELRTRSRWRDLAAALERRRAAPPG